MVGIDAAAWRYYGVSPHQLSWAENALLAVLPNSPALLYPGRNTEPLLRKRNRLLRKLWQHEQIDSLTYALAISEALPEAPQPLPTLAPRLLTRLINEGHQGRTGEVYPRRSLAAASNHLGRAASSATTRQRHS